MDLKRGIDKAVKAIVANLQKQSESVGKDFGKIEQVASISANNDNAVAIDAFWESKDFEADEKGRLARWMQTEIWALGNAVTVDYSTDGGLTWNSPSTFTLDSDYPSDDSPDIYYFDVVASRFRLRFRNNTVGETFSLKQFAISYINREARK